MYKFLGTWYSYTSLKTDDITLQKRWKAIVEIIKNIDIDMMFDCVRFINGLKPKNKEFINKLNSTFQKYDATFPIRRNDAELQVLVTSVLGELIESKSNLNTKKMALSLLTSYCTNLNKRLKVREIVEIAYDFLIQDSRELRLLKVQSKSSKIDFSREKDINNDLNVVQPEIDRLYSTLNSTAQKANEDYKSTNHNLRVLLEESNILWWLFGEMSRDLELHFSELDFPANCIIIGKELSDLTTFSLPHPNAKPILSKILKLTNYEIQNEIKIKDAINKTPESLLINLNENNTFSNNHIDLCPIIHALSKKAEIKNSRAWVTAFDSVSKIKANSTIKPLDFSYQSYLEFMFLN